MLGMSFAGNYCAEQMLLLKYSVKSEREKNMGLLKATNGIGAFAVPCLVSVSIAFADYWLAYETIAIFLAIIVPISYFRLIKSRDIFDEETAKSA